MASDSKIGERGSEQGGRTKGAYRREATFSYRLNSLLLKFSIPTIAAVATGLAVVAALIVHMVIGFLLFGRIGREILISAPIVTVAVAFPLIVYSVTLLRRAAESRRALKAMTDRLAMALDSAEQANRAKSQFLANMSHELRTPLNAIIGFSEVMHEQMLGPLGAPRYQEYARDIHDSGRHLLGIINEILDLAKIEAGHADAETESECELAALADSVLRMIRPLADKKSIALSRELPPSSIVLRAVERMLRQVLLNLLSNAIKFTPEGGAVSLKVTASPESGVLISVTDTGVGMSEEERRIALTAFGQVRNSMTAEHAGTGLGLPLARAMTEMHGGRLVIRSAPGRGTTVDITLPADRIVLREAGRPFLAIDNGQPPRRPAQGTRAKD